MNQAKDVGDMVYPRACGGTNAPYRINVYGAGLSPRLRGNPHAATTENATTGSIPAPAGEPQTSPNTIATVTGLSPRLRGNPVQHPILVMLRRDRSIPAPAGEPPIRFGFAKVL